MHIAAAVRLHRSICSLLRGHHATLRPIRVLPTSTSNTHSSSRSKCLRAAAAAGGDTDDAAAAATEAVEAAAALEAEAAAAAGAAAMAAAAAAAAARQRPVGGVQQQHKPLEAALYVVGTPIGNLEDISLRALRVLSGANLILAEDTRHSRRLLAAYSITTPTLSCHQYNEVARRDLVLQRLRSGEPIALVSDAGMPGISDPGSLLVAAVVEAGLKVIPIPGPCAAIAALAGAGLPTDTFHFVGFLPPKSGRRRAALAQLQGVAASLVFYAPPHGLASILVDAAEVLGGGRRGVVARELTKLHEEFFRGSLDELVAEFGPGGRRAVKGEVVLLVQGSQTTDPLERQLAAAAAAAAAGEDIDAVDAADEDRTHTGTSGSTSSSSSSSSSSGSTAAAAAPATSSEALLRQLVAQRLAGGASVSATAKALAQQLGLPRSRVYRLALELEQQGLSGKAGG